MLAYRVNNEGKNADSMKPTIACLVAKKDITRFKADLMFKIKDWKI